MQKDVYTTIGLKPAHYSKLENGLVEPSIHMVDALAKFYGITIDELVHYQKEMPKAVTMDDKGATEQVRLIAQLNDKDRSTVMNIIETMLTKQKFQDFFAQNMAAQ